MAQIIVPQSIKHALHFKVMQQMFLVHLEHSLDFVNFLILRKLLVSKI